MTDVEIMAMLPAFLAVIVLIYKIHKNTEQLKMQTFLSYTQRYQDIFIHLPVGAEKESFSIDGLGPEAKEEIQRWIRAYFDLCSEEFFLNKNGLIHNKAWGLWKLGMRDSLNKPAFRQTWRAIQSNNYFQSDFASFIDKIIEDVRSH